MAISVNFVLSPTDRALFTKLTGAIDALTGALMATDANVLALVAQVQGLKDAVATDAANKKAAADEITAAIKEINDLLSSKTGTTLTAADVAAVQQATADIQAAAATAVTPINLPALPPETAPAPTA